MTFPQSPAFQFYPAAYSPSGLLVALSNGTAFRPAWTDARLSYDYDPVRLTLTVPPVGAPVFGLLNARYTGPAVTRIAFRYRLGGRSANASVALTVVDVRNVTLAGPGPDAVLYRLYCSGSFQSAAFRLSAYVDGVGSLQVPAARFNLSLTRPGVAAVRGAAVVGVSQGSTDVVASWWGFTAVYRNLTVLNASVTYVDAYSPPYTFTGPSGQILPLSLSLGQLTPGAPGAEPGQPVLLPSPGFVTVLPPPSVRLTAAGDALYSVSNSPGAEFVTFLVTTCGASAQSYQAPVLVNLAPGPYDVDLGAEGPVLALDSGPDSGAHHMPYTCYVHGAAVGSHILFFTGHPSRCGGA